jgi:hypothetical protein
VRDHEVRCIKWQNTLASELPMEAFPPAGLQHVVILCLRTRILRLRLRGPSNEGKVTPQAEEQATQRQQEQPAWSNDYEDSSSVCCFYFYFSLFLCTNTMWVLRFCSRGLFLPSVVSKYFDPFLFSELPSSRCSISMLSRAIRKLKL